jgi:GTPase involved in cell partitioning and DNA repair
VLLQAEVAAYDPALLQLPALVVANKMDAVANPAQVLAELKAATPLPIIPVSSVQQAGLERLKEALLALVGAKQSAAAA